MTEDDSTLLSTIVSELQNNASLQQEQIPQQTIHQRPPPQQYIPEQQYVPELNAPKQTYVPEQHYVTHQGHQSTTPKTGQYRSVYQNLHSRCGNLASLLKQKLSGTVVVFILITLVLVPSIRNTILKRVFCQSSIDTDTSMVGRLIIALLSAVVYITVSVFI